MQTYSPYITNNNPFIPHSYGEPSSAARSHFTSDEIASVARSFDDFKQGRTLSLEQSEADSAELVASFMAV